MQNADERDREIEALRDRLSSLTEASLRINESLDLDRVLQGVLDSARTLTGARYGVITLLDDSGRIQDFLSSGMTAEEAGQLWELPDGMRFFEYLSRTQEPLRLPDLLGHIRSLGLPEFRPPVAVSPVVSFLAAAVLHRGERVGNINVAEKEAGREFTREDEETLVMFASQAALVIANARRHRDEQRARADLETLISTSPVGVVVFDARTGNVVSLNREAGRIVGDLRMPDGSVEQLLEVLTFRRADGREISLEEFPLAQALSTGETVRAEEIVIQVPDGRSVTTLVNATPIHSEDGGVESVVVTLQDMTPLEELERLRAEFLAMVSHELRAPLTSIKGSAATLICFRVIAGPGGDAPVPQDHRRAGRPHAGSHDRPAGRGPHRGGRAVGLSRTHGRRHTRGPRQEHIPERRGKGQHPGRPAAGPAQGDGGQAALRPGAGQPAVQRRHRTPRNRPPSG